MKRLILTLLMLALLLTACGGENEDSTQSSEAEVTEPVEETVDAEEAMDETSGPETDETTQEVVSDIEETVEEEIDLTGLGINPLTGLYIPEEIVNRRPVGVMINNLKKAMPQSGIAQADVIYETLVEGGIARLFAVFKDFDAEKIGPVRSARHYYLDFSFDFDALYVHYGASDQAFIDIRNLNAPNMNGLSYLDAIMCFQDSSRVRPHSTYTSYEGLMAGWEAEKYRTEYADGFSSKFQFAEENPEMLEAVDANKVILDFSYYQYAWFDYDEVSQKYLRNQFGGPQIDRETGDQLAFDNVIVQMAEMWKIPGDTEGRLDMTLVGEGDGYYISHGKAIPITWSKSSHYEPTQYFLTDGSELEMYTGKTWIAVFPTYRPEGFIIE